MRKRRESQNQKIYEYLLTHKRGITSLEAVRKYGCLRLAARIADIEKIYKVEVLRYYVEVDTGDGEKARVKRYFIDG